MDLQKHCRCTNLEKHCGCNNLQIVGIVRSRTQATEFSLWILSLLFPLGWSGTESIITEAVNCLSVPDQDDECGAIGGTLGRGNQSTRKNPVPVLFVHHKSYMT
jgi:hypothetical protein